MLRAISLCVEGAESCLTSGPAPRLSWKAEPVSRGGTPPVPVAAEPEVHAEDGTVLWSPGALALPRHCTTRLTVPPEAALPPDTACRWRVRLAMADGVWGPWSAWHAFGTGLFAPPLLDSGGDDGVWSGQWIAREPGGRAPLRIEDGALRWHGTPFTPAPAQVGTDFTLEAELRTVFGSAGLAFHSSGPGTGLLLELDGAGCVTLRPLPRWEQPAEPSDWATIPCAAADVGPGPACVAAKPGDGPFRHIWVNARNGRLAVVVDGRSSINVPLPTPAGAGLALHAPPRAEGALRSLRIWDGDARKAFAFGAADGLAPWPTTTQHRQPDEWTLLRTEEPISGPVRRAVLYAAARHQAWISINGREVLTLSSFGYPGEDYYDAADVTETVRAAGQRVAVASLSHWYGPGQGRAAGQPGVLAELRIEYDDGSRDVLATGPRWRAAEAPYGQGGYRNDEGDPVEHALGPLPAGWDLPGFDDSAWDHARVVGDHPCTAFPALHPRRAHAMEQREKPVRWLEADDGTPVADFGTVRARRPRAEWPPDLTKGAGSGPTRFRAGYTVRPDGHVDDGVTASQNTDMSFLVDPAAATGFDARVHLGFRYLEVDGARPASLDTAVVHAAHPAESAVVACSDPELTRVLQLLQDSALHGVQERFVDTPTREKGQFLADAANISYATMTAFGEREFTRQALREFTWSGKRYWNAPGERGRVNAVYPNGDGKRDIPDFSLMLPEWAEAYWLHSGDDAFIAEILPALEATCAYIVRSVPSEGPVSGLVTWLEGGAGPYLHGIVDWPAPNRFGYDMTTAARTTVNAQAFASLAATARLAEAVGREAQAAGLHARAMALAEVMERRLRVEGVFVDGLLPDGTPSPHASQHATVFPLAVGATAPEHRADDARRAAALGLRMGPMTWNRFLAALIAEGLVNDALDVALSPERGPRTWLARGATFAWESWDLAPGSDHSQSHAWAAAAWPVIVDGILGLRRIAPGRFDLRPPDSRLEWSRASLPLEQGTLRVAWQRGPDGVVELEYEAPPGVEVSVRPR